MTYLNTSANVENSMLTSLLAPVTESKTTGGMLQISHNGRTFLNLTIKLNMNYFSIILFMGMVLKHPLGWKPGQITQANRDQFHFTECELSCFFFTPLISNLVDGSLHCNLLWAHVASSVKAQFGAVFICFDIKKQTNSNSHQKKWRMNTAL